MTHYLESSGNKACLFFAMRCCANSFGAHVREVCSAPQKSVRLAWQKNPSPWKQRTISTF